MKPWSFVRALLHLLKQKFTFKEMEGILYEKISQMYQQGKEKRKQAVQIIVRKKKVFLLMIVSQKI